MYHCHVHFYFTGQNCRVFEIIKESSRPENFTYTFAADEVPEKNAASAADVIVANL